MRVGEWVVLCAALLLLASCQQERPARVDAVSGDAELSDAAEEVMRDMEAMSWYAPSLHALRTAIAKQRLVSGSWPEDFSELGVERVPFSYSKDGVKVQDALSASDTSFTLKSVDVGITRYDIVLRGVEALGQEFRHDEIELEANPGAGR